MKNKIKILLLFLIIIPVAVFLIRNSYYFFRKYDHGFFSRLYSESQYVKGELSEGGIGDDGLYAFAGYYYLWQGGDISSVNFEHPPLGKYFIGLSIGLFQNENVINLIYYLLLLFTTYKLALLILKNKILALLSVLLVAQDKLILDNLLRSLLDLPFSLFFLAGYYFFIQGLKYKKNLYLSMLFWGMAFSTRFFPVFIFVYVFMLFIVFIRKRKHFPVFLIASILVPSIYLLTHTVFFVYHPSIIEFIRHKVWMISWFKGSPIIVGNIWQNIFTGQYIDPTGQLVKNNHWSILLPVSFVFALFVMLLSVAGKKPDKIKITAFLCILFLIYVTFLTNGQQKFIMPILPLLSILASSGIGDFYSRLFKAD